MQGQNDPQDLRPLLGHVQGQNDLKTFVNF